jgi:hypothetical protein
MGTDCIGSCKANYHMIMTTMATIMNTALLQTISQLHFGGLFFWRRNQEYLEKIADVFQFTQYRY